MIRNRTRLAVAILLAGLGASGWTPARGADAGPLTRGEVPGPLQPWVDWVLRDQSERFCSASADAARRPLCHWPSHLALDLDADGGRFVMHARMQASGWLALPGEAGQWPQQVDVDGRRVAVLDQGGVPSLWLETGNHRVAGTLAWTEIPESLRVPAALGLLELRVEGRTRPHPLRDRQHRLWLGQRPLAPVATVAAERLELRVFRLIDDSVPARLHTRIEIEAGGAVREVTLGPVLPDGLRAIGLSGNLPARLQPDGRLLLQLRPGRWTVNLDAHTRAPLQELTAPAPAAPWPEQELWSFRAQPALRGVELSGLAAVDPRQAGVPAEWAELPSYLAPPGASLTLHQTRRGDTGTASDRVQLQRDLWLDFDGGGYTLRDQLGGELRRQWRLDAQPPITLGAVRVGGQPQPVTEHDGRSGVELRDSQLDLQAHARIDGPDRRLPANGWNLDLQEAQTTLHLPPGWRLVAAPGSDNLADTWLSRWSLLDLFLVLVVAIAALRLFGAGAGILSLVTLALTWHEPGAPRWSWLHLIAVIALLRVLPAGFEQQSWPRRALQAYRWLAVGLLAFVALPFAVQQARLALYPQLEVPGGAARGIAARSVSAEPVLADVAMQAESDAGAARDEAAETRRYKAEAPADADLSVLSAPAPAAQTAQTAPRPQRVDAKQLTQTGPGLPDWHWRSTTLRWSGPVTTDQHYRLWLMPPWLGRLLNLAGIVLIAMLALRWILPPSAGGWRRLLAAGRGAAVLLVPASLMLAMTVAPTPLLAAGPFPSPELLQQLQQRLTAPPGCAPHCAQWSRLDLRVLPGERLALRLTAHAEVDAALALPLPALPAEASRTWQPERVLIDGRDATWLRDDAGRAWIDLPAGVSEVLIAGALDGFDQLQLPTAPAPRQTRTDTPGWRVGGVDARGRAGGVIDLAREAPADARTPAADIDTAQALPPLLHLDRRFDLGLNWQMESTLLRQGSAQTALVLRIPALEGEVVTGEAVRREADQLELSLAPGQRLLRWRSSLPIVPRLSLRASDREDLFETWQFDASPMWNLRFEGLPTVAQGDLPRRLQRFQPWPGEIVDALIERPASVDGQVLTIDHARLQTRPGRRATDHVLDLEIRAGQGGTHRLPLPPAVEVRHLEIDGRAQPPRREADTLVLPIRPGTQSVQLQLRSADGIAPLLRTPALDLANPGVNARLEVQLPADRWVLLAGGPALGPAVLFWAVLAVLLAIAVALGRSGLTPLRAWQWALLGIGLSQLSMFGAALVAGWLFALSLRGRLPAGASPRVHNSVQVLLVVWTVAALATLFGAVAQGLLGSPEMQIAGNGSGREHLYWYQDRFSATLPQAWVLSVSIWFYRALMMLWALWLANSLLNWLRWGWTQFATHTLWKRSPRVTCPDPGPQGGSSP